MDKKIQIRNSTIDFLVFTKHNGEDGIEVRIHDEDVWLTQKSMAQLFDCSTDNISLHLKNIFASGELNAETVTEKSSATASDGKKYRMNFYNLDYAERQAKRQIPMTMEDWAKRLDIFLEFNEEEILRNKGKVSAEIAKSFAESEFEKYRIIQDRLYQSDFDKLLLGIDNGE